MHHPCWNYSLCLGIRFVLSFTILYVDCALVSSADCVMLYVAFIDNVWVQSHLAFTSMHHTYNLTHSHIPVLSNEATVALLFF